MAFQTPSWITGKPTDFIDAAATGASLGLRKSAQADDAANNAARLALESQRIAQESVADQARIAIAAQQLDQAERKIQMDSEMSRERLQKNVLLSQHRNNIAQAYHTAQIGIAKTKLEDAARQSATASAHKHGFALAIASGKSPAEAAAQYPLAMTAGVATQISRPDPQAYETVTEVHPETRGKPGIPAVEKSRGFLGFGAHPASPAVPPVPPQPETRITRRFPVGTQTSSMIPEQFRRGSPTDASAPVSVNRPRGRFYAGENPDASPPNNDAPPVPAPEKRIKGKAYMSPSGRVGTWTGTGWQVEE